MHKFSAIMLLCLFSVLGYAQNMLPESDMATNILSEYSHLSMQQLLDTANSYFNRHSVDTALICYNIVISSPVNENDAGQQMRVVNACNNAATLYLSMSDYRNACDLWIKALLLCEKYGFTSFEAKIYNNLGNIYASFKKNDIAMQYFLKALELNTDSIGNLILLNNMGIMELENGELNKARRSFAGALQISKKKDNVYSAEILNSIASFYRTTKQYDSAFYYIRQSLASCGEKLEIEARNLLDLSNLFFEAGQTDSALQYINRLNVAATENDFTALLSESYLTLSKIEESKELYKKSLESFKTYVDLKDSILDTKTFSDVSQLQRLYEVSKTNEQIERLAIEQQIKERTIRYQKIILFIIIAVLLLAIAALLYVFSRERRLSAAYKTLVEKNVEIIELQEKPSEKNQRHAPANSTRNEVLNKIMILMEDTSIICDADFSLGKLAVLVQSNQNYVSDVINNILNKNFRSFLNSYRIREAQRIFQEPDVAKYTIEAIALQTGFRSSSTFRAVFKEITGVSPAFYLKQIQERKLRDISNSSQNLLQC